MWGAWPMQRQRRQQEAGVLGLPAESTSIRPSLSRGAMASTNPGLIVAAKDDSAWRLASLSHPSPARPRPACLPARLLAYSSAPIRPGSPQQHSTLTFCPPSLTSRTRPHVTPAHAADVSGDGSPAVRPDVGGGRGRRECSEWRR